MIQFIKEHWLKSVAQRTITQCVDSRETKVLNIISLIMFGATSILFLFLFVGNCYLGMVCIYYFLDAFVFHIILFEFFRLFSVAVVYKKENPIEFQRDEHENNYYHIGLRMSCVLCTIIVLFIVCYIAYFIKMIIEGPFVWSFSYQVLFERFHLGRLNGILTCILSKELTTF